MNRKSVFLIIAICLAFFLSSCGNASQPLPESQDSDYVSVEGIQIKMITENAEVVITLNDSRAAADLVAMLPLELTLLSLDEVTGIMKDCLR